MLLEIFSVLHRWVVLVVLRGVFNLFRGKGETAKPTKPENSILRCSAVDLASKIRRQEVSSVTVLYAFIDRIREINPLLNCVVEEPYKAALADAEAADKLIASGRYSEQELEAKFPFLGLPFSTKDHNAVKGLLCTSGVLSRKDVRSDEDSDSVDLMRKAGAIPFVLTNVPEMCMSCETYNVVFGQTNNAYDTNRVPGGSSGGEGSLLSASGSPLGIGTDTGGSIRLPSFFSGVFGHKPSGSIVSPKGIFPVMAPPFEYMACVGPMSRYAEDLLPTLKVLASENAAQLRLDEPVDLRQLKVFYQLDDGGSLFSSNVDADIRSCIQKAADHLHSVCDQAPKKTQLQSLRDAYNMWANCIFAEDFSGLVPNVWWELVKSAVGLSNYTLQCISLVLMGKIKYSDAEKENWKSATGKLNKEFAAMLGTDGVFLYPTHPTVASYHSELILRFHNIVYTGTFNVLGLPSTAVPLGIGSEGLPIGLQVVANHGQDRLCLAVARELEKAFGGWVEPGKKLA